MPPAFFLKSIFSKFRNFFAPILLVGLTSACHAQTDSRSDYETVVAFPNLKFERPIHLVTPPDETNRLFVIEQEGRVSWFENRPDISEQEIHVALDLTDKVRSPVSEQRENRGHNEEGLLGIAFHPEFSENRYLFLHYSATNPPGSVENQRGVISRFQMDEDRRTVDRQSEKVILEVDQFQGNHNGGMLEFGPDGYLYLSFGDGGGAGDPRKNAQNLSVLLGKILRIDVDREEDDHPYSIPDDNPFIDRDDARREIFAYGLRNVWRFSFDPENGALWAGDVCQNAWEKIYLIGKGENFGWPYVEGTHEYDGFPEGFDRSTITPPIAEHPHSETRSITGGHVYLGKRLPKLRKAFIYGDFVTGAIFALWYDYDKKEVTRHERIGTAPAISSFGTDRLGELYILSLNGTILRLQPK